MYVLYSEDGDVLQVRKLTQEHLVRFDQNCFPVILEVTLGNPGDGDPKIMELKSLNTEELDDDEQEAGEKEHYEGTHCYDLEWKEVQDGG